MHSVAIQLDHTMIHPLHLFKCSTIALLRVIWCIHFRYLATHWKRVCCSDRVWVMMESHSSTGDSSLTTDMLTWFGQALSTQTWLYWSSCVHLHFLLRHLLSLCSEAFSVCPLDPFRRNAKGKYTLNYNTAPTIVWVSGSIYRVFDWENNRSELLMGKWLKWNDLICNSLQSSTKIKLWQERKPHSYPLFKCDGCLHSVYSYRLTVL